MRASAGSYILIALFMLVVLAAVVFMIFNGPSMVDKEVQLEQARADYNRSLAELTAQRSANYTRELLVYATIAEVTGIPDAILLSLVIFAGIVVGLQLNKRLERNIP